MMGIRIFALLAFTMLGHPETQPGFLGLKVGMKATDALPVIGKNPDMLERVKAHDGQRVVSDFLPISDCELTMRRSLGFDSSETLTAIGLTYKTTPDRIEDARDCAFQWLTKMYGPPMTVAHVDSVTQEVWHYDEVKLTLEARQYNSHDVFVLIYYYKEDKNGRTTAD